MARRERRAGSGGESGRRFARRREDFRCERCGREVTGSGYTNHCPACLWSKHVDVLPGDRSESCGGEMEPLGVIAERGRMILVHRCTRCGAVRRNRTAADDDRATLELYYGRPVPEES